ncbi:MAG: NADH-quinone oxidoreductase subunit J [Deltaproteobacteria bacterium]|nr:NADH-quinone oxidoreductase subunit J [Deltaproteobacteria bacterium]
MSVEQALFYPLAILSTLGALGVVLAKNPLHGALWLVCSFFFLAAIYVVLGAHLVGILQIIVYAGAIMVLFLFVIMLLALSEADLGERKVTLFKILGGAAALSGIGIAARLVFAAPPQTALRPIPADFGTVAAVGRTLFTEFPLQFEAVSLLLLVAIAGAVVVAKARI